LNGLHSSQPDSPKEQNIEIKDDVEGKNDTNYSVSTRSFSVTKSLTRKIRKKLANEIIKSNSLCMDLPTEGSSITLKRRQARPPGCTFLGAKAIVAPVCLTQENCNPTELVIDSGSDITLMSENHLKNMKNAPKIKTGQKINLVQLTGSATIAGFVNLPIIFSTPSGPVRMDVEAYVVKGMTTPLILGNDFADQYDLSLLRQDGQTKLLLGSSQRYINVENSTSPFLDEQGKPFKIRVIPPMESKCLRVATHKRQQRLRRTRRRQHSDPYVRSSETVVIPPESVKKVHVSTLNLEDGHIYYAERLLNFHHDVEDCYGPPDSLITSQEPYLAVTNFSRRPLTIPMGQALAIKRNPSKWLKNKSSVTPKFEQEAETRSCLIKALAKSLENQGSLPENSTSDEPLEGGPKTAEPAPSPQKNVSLSEIDISPHLSESQFKALKKILEGNKSAFGLGMRLGQYPAKVSIRLKEGTEPISLPPFAQSPAKREVMDKQMDEWIQLKVIEPSISPWGAPAFIVYRNNKPRMVIDYRKLNDCVIPDEFPLPKQDDILQALTGAQWLSTFDALAGFTQLEMANDSKEVTAFRCHRGLYQFRRLPFGYRNGPSVFQRVMQGILSAYLWIFTLVYIDDIVVYSKTFEDHLKHVNLVLKAISNAGITLSPPKCHLGYQSLQLLGQQVSRLGLSTHKEKVDAIVQLAEPRNVHELQTFLGMMVYFSAYIPFYAWVVAPLFKLLRKGTTWKWSELEQEAFDLSKEILTNAPVRAYAIPGLGYRLYSDACDYGLAAILQQVQPIAIKDLKGTRAYEKLEKAFKNGESVPSLVSAIAKDGSDLPPQDIKWANQFEDTVVRVERVIAYWSRTLKPAEQNYSPTEREALALKEGLIKFQSYIEGERIDAITDHAALTWSKTFQNVNRRLLSWGTTFAAYPNLHIVHRAGRVHSNVDPISRLRRRVPIQEGPSSTDSQPSIPSISEEVDDPLKDIYNQLTDQLEAKVLSIASTFQHEEEKEDTAFETEVELEDFALDEQNSSLKVPCAISRNYSISIHIDSEEIQEWSKAYSADSYFSKVIESLREEPNPLNPQYPQYFLSDEGLLYFEDWEGNNRLCVPTSLRNQVMKEDHESLTEGAHCGYHRAFNRLASMYFWPRMSKDIREYVTTCDICQKTKAKRHAPVGLLRPIPIPSKPFEVITMDFIPELPITQSGFNNILVIVDKLTKFAIFIPTITSLDEKECAKLVFDNVFTRFGLPKQIITDRDSRWTGYFWEEICKLFDIKRALTTAHHPQADGQTEIMNQVLETALRTYVNPQKDNWDSLLSSFSLSYNSTPHSTTGFSPSMLLFGYQPRSGITRETSQNNEVLRTSAEAEWQELQAPTRQVPEPRQPAIGTSSLKSNAPDQILVGDSVATKVAESFDALRTQAKDALVFAQVSQQRNYNKGRLTYEFDVGDRVLLNPHSLQLYSNFAGTGRKLLRRYDGPFEIIEKLSPVTYRLRLPSSYQLHPVLNIAHLEPYRTSPDSLGPRTIIPYDRAQSAAQEWEVERIVAERTRKRGTRRVPYYRVRYTGFGPEHDEWIPRSYLKNAPEVLRDWLKGSKVRESLPKSN
jgi:hypothetical protein